MGSKEGRLTPEDAQPGDRADSLRSPLIPKNVRPSRVHLRGGVMDRSAHDAVETSWRAFIHVRALCPSARDSFIGATSYQSPSWYRNRGARYTVSLPAPFTDDDLTRLQEGTSFVNRSFIITLAAILEAYEIVPYRVEPDRSLDGGDHVQLVKWLRNRYAHGEYEYDATNEKHVETRQLLENVLPDIADATEGFPASIDSVLEPLKDGVLQYIDAFERLA